MFSRVYRNTSYLMAYQVFNKFLFFGLLMAIARMLGPSALGQYAFVFVFEYFLIFTVSLGTRTLMVREISCDRDIAGRVLGNLMLLTVLLFILLLPAVYLASLRLGGLTGLLVIVIWFDAFLGSFINLFESYFRSYQKMGFEALMYSSHDLVVVAASLLMLFRGYGLLHVIYAFVFSKLFVTVVFSIFLSRRFPRPEFRVDLALCRRWAAMAFPFLVNDLFMLMIFRIDILMILFFRGDFEVGLYESGYTLIRNMNSLSAMFIVCLFPVFSRGFDIREAGLFKGFRKAVRELSLFNFLAYLGLFAVSPFILRNFFGGEFIQAAPAVRVLVVSGVFLSLCTLNSYFLNALRREWLNLRLVFSMGLLNFLLNLIIIPKYGFTGAAYSTLATYILLLLFQSVYVRREMDGYHFPGR